MPLQLTGEISLANIQTEFGGANPISLSEYYSDGIYVPNSTIGYPGGVVTTIPTSSQQTISFANFYGASKRIPTLYEWLTPGTYSWTVPTGMLTGDILVIGGGGGGGQASFDRTGSVGGGGGGGNVQIARSVNLSGTNPTIVVGNGGSSTIRGSTSSYSSSVFSVTCAGGYAGISGIGAGQYQTSIFGGGGAAGNGTAGGIPSYFDYIGGGGGGITGTGYSGFDAALVAGRGGTGGIFTLGTITYTVGGGGGAGARAGNPAGVYGGGAGAGFASGGTAGSVNTGGGGGGAARFTSFGYNPGGTGGSGSVRIYG